MTDLVVGVDIGSGAARAVAVDRDGRILGAADVRYRGCESWAAGHADPQAWRAAVDEAIGTLAAQVPDAAHPAAIGIGGQSPCAVRSDGADAITIMHPSANEPDVVAAHLAMWAAVANGAAEQDGLTPCQSWDWILRSMGARPCHGQWPASAVLPGFGPSVRTGTVVGEAAPGGPVAPGTPLVPGAVDAFSAFWAAGVDTPGMALDPGGRTGGVGIAVQRGADRPRDHGLASAAAGVDIVGGPVTGHGLAVEWWSAMTGRSIEDALAEAAAVEPGAGGIVVLPYLEGERAPRWNPALRAEIVGLGSAAGPAEVMRAVLEGCAFGLRHIVDDAAREGAHVDRLVVAGSPARSALWNQIKADVLGVPVAVPDVTDLASYGDALAAGSAVGWWPPPGDGSSGDWPTVPTTIVEPRRHEVYEEAYVRWVALGDAAVERLATLPPRKVPS